MNIGISTRPLLSRFQKDALGALKYKGGVRVVRVEDTSSFYNKVKKDDILYEINNKVISEVGILKHPVWGGVHYHWYLNTLSSDSKIKLSIIRSGKKFIIEGKVKRHDSNKKLIPLYSDRNKESYLVFAGILFQELSYPYLLEWGKNWQQSAPIFFVHKWLFNNFERKKDERVVLINKILADRVNQGYDEIKDVIVTKVNGSSVDSLWKLRQALQKPILKEGVLYAYIELAPLGNEIVLRYEDIPQSHKRISENYGITEKEHLFQLSK